MSEENTIDSIGTYLEYITFLKEDYPNSPFASSPIDTNFLFRGISNHEFSLLPSVYRTHETSFAGLEIKNSLYLSFADESGIIKEFRNEARRYLTGTNIENFINWAEYAQHYNVPTRLLDWTSNPLVALYFACCGSEDISGSVWCLHHSNYLRLINTKDNEIIKKLNVESISKFYDEMLKGTQDLSFPIVFVPNYFDSRMSMQSSYFMLWGNDKRPLEQIFGDDYHIQYKHSANGVHSFGRDQETKLFMKLFIPSGKKQPLLRSLDMIGINKKTLFPGLDGLGEHLKWKYQFNKNDDVL